MSWLRNLMQGVVGAARRNSHAQPVPVTVASGSASSEMMGSRPLPIASIGAAPRERADGRALDQAQAAVLANEYVTARFGACILEQVAAFPLTADGNLTQTVDSAWHFGYWVERNGPDWPRSYVSVRLEPSGSPDPREHARYETPAGEANRLELARCIPAAHAIREALRAGLTVCDDATYHVVYLAASEGQPAMVRVSSHRAGTEMDHRAINPYNGKALPPLLKAKKGRPILTR